MPIPLASICTCALLTQTSRWTFFFRLGVANPNSSTFESKKLFFLFPFSKMNSIGKRVLGSLRGWKPFGLFKEPSH